MNTPDLKALAMRTRQGREAGVALVLASVVLALFLFVPIVPSRSTSNTASAVTVATSTDDGAFSAVPLQAKAAIVYDVATGETLYAKNASAQLPLASLTKLLTMYAAFSLFPPSTPITIPADVAGLSAPHAFMPGETFALSDLARLTLTGSLNDGAAAIAEAAAADESRTVTGLMASVASSLDLSQTYAVNGNGLDVSTALAGAYGSARDIAVLAGALAKSEPGIMAATTEPSATAVSSTGRVVTVKNTDPMTGTFQNLLLSKTGYTDLAGGNLAIVFDAGIGHPVAVVVLGSTEKARFTDAEALVAATLAHFAGVSSL